MDIDIAQALACARSVFGDVGLVAWAPLPDTDGPAARMVLLTESGGRTAIIRSGVADAQMHAELDGDATSANLAPGRSRLLAVSQDPPLLLFDDDADAQ